MKIKRLIMGSRSSKLAIAQAASVLHALKGYYPELEIEIKTIKTRGDKIPDVSLNKVEGRAFFTKEIEEALLKRKIDFAVHSMKDLPTELPQGLKIAAVPKRDEPLDALISAESFTIDTLPKGSTVGTGSLRRRSQLLHTRGDLKILSLRGNVDTRVNKLRQGMYDAIILAFAGIKRLDLKLDLSIIPIEKMLPQAGQGALGIEIRQDTPEIENLLKVIDDGDSHLSIDAERVVLAALQGGCQVPIGVYACIVKDRIIIKAGIFSLDGKSAVKEEASCRREDALNLSRQLAEKILKSKTARRILGEVKDKS